MGIYFILVRFTDSPVPVGDAITTALGIVATWMLAKRIIEHWYLWIVANFISIYVSYLQELYPTMFLYLCYTIISVIGLYTWRKRGERGGNTPPAPSQEGKSPLSCSPPSHISPPTSHFSSIVANGTFPSSPTALEVLRKAPSIIACDGAVEKLHAEGFVPDHIVGDLDSIPEQMRQRYADRIHYDKDQDTNDLTKAVRFAHRSGIKEIIILGATGLREDHTLGNISLLADYITLFDKVEMLTDYGLFTPIHKTTTFESYPGQQISIFSLTPETKLTTEGLRWPINDKSLTSWWQGTLNEALGNSFTVRLSEEGKVIVFQVRN